VIAGGTGATGSKGSPGELGAPGPDITVYLLVYRYFYPHKTFCSTAQLLVNSVSN